MKLCFLAVISSGMGQLVPGLDNLPSFAATPIVNTFRGTLKAVLPAEFPGLTDVDGNAISSEDFVNNLSDEAMVELLSNENALNPTQWDSAFVETVLADQNVDVETYVGYVDTGNAIFGENGIDSSDPFWADPSQWTDQSLEGKLGEIDGDIPADALSGIADTLLQFGNTGAFSGGFSSSSLSSVLDPCMDVLDTAREMIFVPSPSQVLNFDWRDFLINVIGLVNDGSNCYVTYATYQGQTNTITNVLEYSSYIFLAAEKALRYPDNMKAVKNTYKNLLYGIEVRIEVLERYWDISYLNICEKALEFSRFILANQASSLIYSCVGFYNMLVDDIPFISNYEIPASLVVTVVGFLDSILEFLEIEIKSFENMGGDAIVDLIIEQYYPDYAIDDGSQGSFAILNPR